MSRTNKPTRMTCAKGGGSHRYTRRHDGWLRRALTRSERRAVHEALRGELRETDEEWLEILADRYEEQGRLELANELRRGHDPVLPLKPSERVPGS